MNEIEAVTYAESREAFFAGALRKAERQLDWAVKHNPDCYVCAEKGEAVAFYQDALAALRAEEEREKGCEACWDDEDHEPETIGTGLNEYGEECKLLMYHYEPIYTIRFCPMCGRKLDGGGQDARKGEAE